MSFSRAITSAARVNSTKLIQGGRVLVQSATDEIVYRECYFKYIYDWHTVLIH
jgi:hypothetical protein